MVVTYVIPVAAMGVSYSLMSHVLWRAKGIGELNQRQEESIQSKRKVSQFSFTQSVHSAISSDIGDVGNWQDGRPATYIDSTNVPVHIRYCSCKIDRMTTVFRSYFMKRAYPSFRLIFTLNVNLIYLLLSNYVLRDSIGKTVETEWTFQIFFLFLLLLLVHLFA